MSYNAKRFFFNNSENIAKSPKVFVADFAPVQDYTLCLNKPYIF